MTICSRSELEQSSLQDLLRKKSPSFYLQESNSCFRTVVARFEDCPEGLKDFYRSDWMNLCEAYNYQLLERWEKNRDAIIELFEEFKQANCYGSTLEAVEDSTIEDPEDLAVAIVNKAMTYAAQVLYDVIQDEV